METLNVGMYIRTKDGIIDKVIIDYNGHCASPNCECKHVSCAKNYYDEDKIVKASYDIIDILEVGDYVNGYKIGYIDDCKGAMREFYYDYENPKEDVGNYEEEIKSVITHEQIEQMSYKVGE